MSKITTEHQGYLIQFAEVQEDWVAYEPSEPNRLPIAVFRDDSLKKLKEKIDRSIKNKKKVDFKKVPVFKDVGSIVSGEVTSVMNQTDFIAVYQFAQEKRRNKHTRNEYSYGVYLDNEKNKQGKERLIEINKEVERLAREVRTIKSGLELFEPKSYWKGRVNEED